MRYIPLSIFLGSLPILTGCASTTAGEKQRPAIDLSAPAKFETATFALG
jgi:hypothetical protein